MYIGPTTSEQSGLVINPKLARFTGHTTTSGILSHQFSNEEQSFKGGSRPGAASLFAKSSDTGNKDEEDDRSSINRSSRPIMTSRKIDGISSDSEDGF